MEQATNSNQGFPASHNNASSMTVPPRQQQQEDARPLYSLPRTTICQRFTAALNENFIQTEQGKHTDTVLVYVCVRERGRTLPSPHPKFLSNNRKWWSWRVCPSHEASPRCIMGLFCYYNWNSISFLVFVNPIIFTKLISPHPHPSTLSFIPSIKNRQPWPLDSLPPQAQRPPIPRCHQTQENATLWSSHLGNQETNLPRWFWFRRSRS